MRKNKREYQKRTGKKKRKKKGKMKDPKWKTLENSKHSYVRLEHERLYEMSRI